MFLFSALCAGLTGVMIKALRLYRETVSLIAFEVVGQQSFSVTAPARGRHGQLDCRYHLYMREEGACGKAYAHIQVKDEDGNGVTTSSGCRLAPLRVSVGAERQEDVRLQIVAKFNIAPPSGHAALNRTYVVTSEAPLWAKKRCGSEGFDEHPVTIKKRMGLFVLAILCGIATLASFLAGLYYCGGGPKGSPTQREKPALTGPVVSDGQVGMPQVVGLPVADHNGGKTVPLGLPISIRRSQKHSEAGLRVASHDGGDKAEQVLGVPV